MKVVNNVCSFFNDSIVEDVVDKGKNYHHIRYGIKSRKGKVYNILTAYKGFDVVHANGVLTNAIDSMTVVKNTFAGFGYIVDGKEVTAFQVALAFISAINQKSDIFIDVKSVNYSDVVQIHAFYKSEIYTLNLSVKSMTLIDPKEREGVLLGII